MRKRKVVFRADGNQHIGMGHFIRTLALAEMLKDDFHCIYATQVPTSYQIKEISNVCHDRIDLDRGEGHFNEFLELLQGDEIVVLDNYYFNSSYQSAIKAKGCQLACIDDMHNQHFVADLIINHAEGVKPEYYSSENYTRFCLGFKHALLRPEYLNELPPRVEKKYAYLIMMGGADPMNLSHKFSSFLEMLKPSKPIAVVVGDVFKHIHIFNDAPHVNVFQGISASKVYRTMQESEIGIFPASTVAIEACAARLPFMCGYYVENQKENYQGIKQNELAKCVGNYLNLGAVDFNRALSSLHKKNSLDNLIQHQKNILDKKSKERFIKIFKDLWN